MLFVLVNFPHCVKNSTVSINFLINMVVQKEAESRIDRTRKQRRSLTENQKKKDSCI